MVSVVLKLNTMETGRFFVYCKSGRKFCVEPYGYSHTDWGNLNPATKKIEKVTAKAVEIIDDSNTFITPENGFRNICMLSPGFSPLGFIECLDNSGLERIEMEGVKYL